jgi:hypothetical protein
MDKNIPFFHNIDKNTVLLQRLTEVLPSFQTYEEIFAAFPDGCPILFRHWSAADKWYPGKVRGITPGVSLLRPGSWDLLVEMEQRSPSWRPEYKYSVVSVPLIFLNTTFYSNQNDVAIKYTDSVVSGCYGEKGHGVHVVDPALFIVDGKIVDPFKIVEISKM